MLLKKIVSRLIFPLPLGLELLVLGVLVWSLTRRRRLGQTFVIAGTLWIAAIGYPWAGEWLLPGLSRQNPPLTAERLAAFNPKFIVVPGMGISNDPRYPANLRFPSELVIRLVEAVRLHRAVPGSQILVSISNPEMTAEEKRKALAELMAIFGVDARAVTVLTGLRDTEEEVEGFLRLTGSAPVCLVSSATNLPRAMLLARRHGLNAIASPSSGGGFARDASLPSAFNIVQIFPSAENVGATEQAVYERLGLGFEHIKDFWRR